MNNIRLEVSSDYSMRILDELEGMGLKESQASILDILEQDFEKEFDKRLLKAVYRFKEQSNE